MMMIRSLKACSAVTNSVHTVLTLEEKHDEDQEPGRFLDRTDVHRVWRSRRRRNAGLSDGCCDADGSVGWPGEARLLLHSWPVELCRKVSYMWPSSHHELHIGIDRECTKRL